MFRRMRRLTIRGVVALVAAPAVALVLVGSLDARTLPGALGSASTSTTAIGTITLSPQAVSLPNPASLGRSGTTERRIAVSLNVLNRQGQPITSGTFSRPIKITVYGPSSHVLTAATPVVPSPTGKIYFNYTGGFFANSIIVTAVSGNAFALMSFQPQHRGFPGTSSVAFSMPNSTRNIDHGWGFSASVGGGPGHFVEMDTGSRGLVVPASILGRGAIGPGPAGMIEYTSDGKEFLGNYYLAPIKLTFGGVSVTTVPLRVLAVNKSGCASGYPHCVAGGISGLGVMGVGFDRGAASPMPPELTNAFLALTNIIEGTMHPGYIVRSNGVTLGITAADQADFATVALNSGGSGPGDWNTEPGCFSFPKISGYIPQCGTLLVDTGIASAILGLPKSQRPSSISSSIPNDERIQIDVAASTAATPILSYAFTTGVPGPTAPTSIRWAAGTAPFVNTGRRPISRYRYLFDAGSGKVGFKRG
jgi:hypothetical protein